MYGEGGDTAVLQLLGQLDNNARLLVPPQTGLHRDGYLHGIDYGPGNLQHQRYIPQHAGPGTLAGYLLHRAAEVDVEHVGVSLLAHAGGLDHRIDKAAVNLDGHRALLVVYVQFAGSAVDIAHQRIARHKLRIDHIGPELLAHEAERLVRHIFHRGQKQRIPAKIEITYFHVCI